MGSAFLVWYMRETTFPIVSDNMIPVPTQKHRTTGIRLTVLIFFFLDEYELR